MADRFTERQERRENEKQMFGMPSRGGGRGGGGGGGRSFGRGGGGGGGRGRGGNK